MTKQERERLEDIDPEMTQSLFGIISIIFNPSAQIFLASIFLDWTCRTKIFLPKGTQRTEVEKHSRNGNKVSDVSILLSVVRHRLRLFLFVFQIACGVSCAPCRHLVAWDEHARAVAQLWI